MQLVSSFITVLQYEFLALLFLQDKYLTEGMRENKMMTFFGVWFGGSMFTSAITKTNAFEIYVGRRRVWSTLKNGRTPNHRDLVEAFRRAGVELH
mmetsp:Transcript_13910/g.25639  ORF Transcript_13910/g.25639 Transcript_13910/m.25639 type:complete len:95 (-) Transcript_13910:332-616(-)